MYTPEEQQFIKTREMPYMRDATIVSRLQKPHEDVVSELPSHAERPKKQKLEATQIKNIPDQGTILRQPNVSFDDIGGMDKTLKNVCNLLLHIRHPELYRKLGISPPRGFLLHGPPGCGKTLLANAIAGELGMQMIKVDAFELVSAVSEESEELIRKLFERACRSAPCILFIDEIDAIASNRWNVKKGMEQRIMTQMLNCLDGLLEDDNQVLVIGATNKPDAIDPVLRRAGRLDVEIGVGIPDVKSREEILRVLLSNVTLSPDFDCQKIAQCTPGFVGADLSSLTREAAMIAVNRVLSSIKEQHKIGQTLMPQITTKVQNSKEPFAEKTIDEAAKKQKGAEAIGIPLNTEKLIDDCMQRAKKLKDKDWAVSNAVIVHDAEKLISNFERKDLADFSPEFMAIEESQVHSVEEVKLSWTLAELQYLLHDRSPLSDEQLAGLCITMDDFDKALHKVQPSSKWEGFPTVPETTWNDVGSLRNIREQLQMAILVPLRHSKQFEALGLTVTTGVLLCGPSGCGKSLSAKAIANEAGINLISIKGPELLNMCIGDSEGAVRVYFERARNCAPCIMFFDELDALFSKTPNSREGDAIKRIVNQMLIEMDKVNDRKGIFLLAATSRPDNLDPLILKPGRLDKIIYVGLPSRKGRVEILKAITKNGTQPKLDEDVDLISIGSSKNVKGYTGADLAALVREASVLALKDFIVADDSNKPLMVSSRHFVKATENIRPSAPEKRNFDARRAKLKAHKEKRIKLNEKKIEWLRRQQTLKRARTKKFREQRLGQGFVADPMIIPTPLMDNSPHSTSKGEYSSSSTTVTKQSSFVNYTLNNPLLLRRDAGNGPEQSTLIASEISASSSPLNLKQRVSPPFSSSGNFETFEAVTTTFEDQAIKQEISEESTYLSLSDDFIGHRHSANMYGSDFFLENEMPLVCERQAKAKGSIGDLSAGSYYGSTQAPVCYNPEMMYFSDVSSLKDPGKNCDITYTEEVDSLHTAHTSMAPLSQSEVSRKAHLSTIPQAHIDSSNLLYSPSKERLSQELVADTKKIVNAHASSEEPKVTTSRSILHDDRLIANSLSKTQLPLKKRKLTEAEELSIYIQKFKEEKERRKKENISYSARRQMSIADLQRDFPKVKTLAARKLYPEGTGAFSEEQDFFKYPQFDDFDGYSSKRPLVQVYINGVRENSSYLMIGSMHSCMDNQSGGTIIEGNQYPVDNQNQSRMPQELLPQAFDLRKPALREQLPQNRIKQARSSLDTPSPKRARGRPRKIPK